MKTLLSLIAGLAIVVTIFEAMMLAIDAAIAAFLIFVVAGAASAVLEYLANLHREAKAHTALLERIARSTAKPGEKPVGESSVSYKIPGIG